MSKPGLYIPPHKRGIDVQPCPLVGDGPDEPNDWRKRDNWCSDANASSRSDNWGGQSPGHLHSARKIKKRQRILFSEGCSTFGCGKFEKNVLRRGPVPKSWFTGTIVAIRDDKGILFVKLENPDMLPKECGWEDLMVPINKFPEFVLDMRKHDLVTVKLNVKQGGRPKGKRAHVIRYHDRTDDEVIAYLDKLAHDLRFETRKVLLQVLSPTYSAQWLFLCNRDGTCEEITRKVVDVMMKIIQYSDQYDIIDFSKETILIFLKGKLLVAYIRATDLENSDVITFSKHVASYMPGYFHKIMPLIEMLISDSKGHPKVTLLLDIIKCFSKRGSSEQASSTPLFPSTKELLGQPMERSEDLDPVKDKAPYSSYNEYEETYFKLLRAECFSSIQKGILELTKEVPDNYDMNCFKNIRLAGIQMSGKRPSFAISFKPVKHVRDWKKSTQLMYGNLVCLSPCQDFSDPIWGVVSNRDENLLNEKSQIAIEFLESNDLPLYEILIALIEFDGETVMVESPTYFETFKSVLATIKSLDLSKYDLAPNIVYGNFDGYQMPFYLTNQSMISHYAEYEYNMDFESDYVFNSSSVDDLIEDYISENCEELEDSQKEAFRHCLNNKLAIIQGPPGTGKTLVGFELLKFILSIGIESPILVLTYKNHALDEFLLKVIDNKTCDITEIVRLGSRSREPRLSSISINNNQRLPILSDLNYILHHQAVNIEDLLQDYLSSSTIDADTLLDVLSEKQVKSFIQNYNFKEGEKIKLYEDDQDIDHEYVCTLLENNFKNDDDGYNEIVCQIFTILYGKWSPNIDDLLKLRKLHQETSVLRDIDIENDDDECESDDENVDEVDEDLVKNIESGRQSYRSDIVNDNSMRPLGIRRNTNGYTLSHFPTSCVANSNLLNVKNLWTLTEIERVQFIATILLNKKESFINAFRDVEASSKKVMNEKFLKINNARIEAIKEMKVIGATITGASINHNLIKAVNPKVVIVEEAAEVLEPSLIAALSPNVEHLILIGDHKQLRPSVDTYRLRRDYKFDISMMERLIKINYPYKTLRKQGRMRTEFAELLKDIYPEYDNLPDLNESRKPFPMLEKSMFFWSHSLPETKFRSVENKGEADMVLYLAFFMIVNGVNPSKITILAPYKGQQKVLRDKYREMKVRYWSLFGRLDDVDIQTIDMYQGDENDFVIISLVRSNDPDDPNIGFLKCNNRRCVAQSRARRGMYFVGNVEMFRNHWKYLVDGMEKSGCVGERITVVCDEHPRGSRTIVDNVDGLIDLVENPGSLCSEGCPFVFLCGHLCTRTCKPVHLHSACTAKVKSYFSDCGHTGIKECSLPESQNACRELVEHTFPCGHTNNALCHDVKTESSRLFCKSACEKRMILCDHECPFLCGDMTHDHFKCLKMVDYTFSGCRHKGPEKKHCYSNIEWNCEKMISFQAECGHTVTAPCYLHLSGLFVCSYPCQKKLSCGHPCTEKCLEQCTTNCMVCRKEQEMKIAKAIELAKNEVEMELKKLDDDKYSDDDFFTTELSREDDDVEFQSIEDIVLNCFQLSHKCYPKVTKVERVYNKALMKEYLKKKLNIENAHEGRKFHWASDRKIRKLIKRGFKLPKKQKTYGKGIYLYGNITPAAQNDASNKVVLCKVILGKSFKFENKDDIDAFLEKEKEHDKENNYGAIFLAERHCSSIYVPRGNKVQNDEFIVFHPYQVYPEFIISYYFDSVPRLPTLPLSPDKEGFRKRTFVFGRNNDRNDPFFSEASIALAHFNRTVRLSDDDTIFNFNTDKVDIIQNPTLEGYFYAKKAEFDLLGKGDEILAFHATGEPNVDSILKNNLDPNRTPVHGRRHGRGCYFSEFPNYSAIYGNSLIIFRVLPGKEYEGPEFLPRPGYDSKKVSPNEKGYGKMIVIQNNHQFLPAYVFYNS